jgi:exosortase D (VPLPA-CTERM-specific)
MSVLDDGLAGSGQSIAAEAKPERLSRRHHLLLELLVGLIAVVCLARIFTPAFQDIYFNWTSFPEYSYGPLVPVIAAILLMRESRGSQVPARSGWAGVGILVLGCTLGLMAAISPFVYPANIGLLVAIVGLYIAFRGWERLRSIWPGFAYLIFALPLPALMFGRLTAELQLVSSEIGVAVIRLFDIPVFREGNIIDLGSLRLQVAEACSGLRYLFPLASFSFLAAYLFQAPAWQRTVLFLSSIPITIAMNSFRIGLTGILANHFGIEAAEGFLHDFEGWLVFCACIGLLVVEMKVFCLLGGGRAFADRLDFSWPRRRIPSVLTLSRPRLRAGPMIAAALVAVLFVVLGSLVVHRTVIAPAREALAEFPRDIAGQRGTDTAVPQETLDALGLTDYLSTDYRGSDLVPIGVWIAYYDAQRVGDATHSPRFCIPGSGWNIDELQTTSVAVPGLDGRRSSIPVNRAIISKDGARQLVYYWFQERGRSEANEYLVKLHILIDGLAFQRTDGALVRLTTPLADRDPATVRAADSRLQSFTNSLYPLLPRYIPN